MEYIYIKKVDQSTLQNDLMTTEIKDYISSVSVSNNVIKINTNIPLSIAQQNVIRNVIIQSKEVSTTEQYIRGAVMPSAKQFAVKLESDFIAENILMGISPLNKTAAVLGVLSKKVPIPGEPEKVSLIDTLHSECPSLTVTLKVLEWHVNNINNYTDLAPFVTKSRLINLTNKIKKYLGI